MKNAILLVLAALLAFPAVPPATARAIELDVYLHELSNGLHLVPDSIAASVGDTVKLTVHNQGLEHDNGPHDVVVCGDAGGDQPPSACNEIWGFTAHLANNQTGVLTATAKSAGLHWYYCDLPGHAQAGMAGRFTVQGTGAAPTKASPGLALLGSLIALAGVALVLRKERS